MKKTVCLFLLVCLSVTLFSCADRNELPDDCLMRVVFLDVGQGDCILIRTSGGDILIDAGPDFEQESLCRKLKTLGVTRLTLAIFTHFDEDHIGGADEVLARFPTKEIWIPRFDGENDAYERFWIAANSCDNVRVVEAGELRRIGDVVLCVLSPSHETSSTGSANDKSIVLKVSCGSVAALLMGDADVAAEKRLLKRFSTTVLSCELLKVGHHGSSTSTSAAFLEAVRPQYAVISCGADNSFGHPHGEVLQRLQAAGVNICRTDLEGDIIFNCDGERFFPITEN